MIHRRTFLTGLLAAPIIVRSGILMPVRPLRTTTRLLNFRVRSGGQWMPTEFVRYVRDGNNVQAVFRTLAPDAAPLNNEVYAVDLFPSDNLSVNILPINALAS